MEILPNVLNGTQQRGSLCRVHVSLALGKDDSSVPHDSLYAKSRKLALGKGSFFAECLSS
jgi:hypothetical protein